MSVEDTRRAEELYEQCRALRAANIRARAALRGLFDCEALEMYRRDDNPEWDAPEIAAARAVLAESKPT